MIGRVTSTLIGATLGGMAGGLPQLEEVAKGEKFNVSRFTICLLAGAGVGFACPSLFRRWKGSSQGVTPPSAQSAAELRAAHAVLVDRIHACGRNLVALETRVAVIQPGDAAAIARLRRRVAGIRGAFGELVDCGSDERVTAVLRHIREAGREADRLSKTAPRGGASLQAAVRLSRNSTDAASGGRIRRTIRELPLQAPARAALERCQATLSPLLAQIQAGGPFAAAEGKVQALIVETATEPGRLQAAQDLGQRLATLRTRVIEFERRFEAFASSQEKPSHVVKSLTRFERELAEVETRVASTLTGVDEEIAAIRKLSPLPLHEQMAIAQSEIAAWRRATTAAPSPVAAPLPAAAPVSPFDIMKSRSGLAGRVFRYRDGPMPLYSRQGGPSLVAQWEGDAKLVMTLDLGRWQPDAEVLDSIDYAFKCERATGGRLGQASVYLFSFAAREFNLESLYYLFERLVKQLPPL